MCGIVGLLIRDPELEGQLGRLLVPMLVALGERGPDSTGLAVYSDAADDQWRISLRRSEPLVWDDALAPVAVQLGRPLQAHPHGNGATVVVDGSVLDVLDALRAVPGVDVLGWGRHMELVKDTGMPASVCDRYGVAGRTGYLGAGHTRMATESAVTALHSHPFAPAADLCVVHNGSFSNHASVRRRLEAEGIGFESDNDSEVAARLVAWRLASGDDLEEAVRWLMKDLDGFFTLVLTSAEEMSVVRDAFACKPAVVAETDRYVAVASEYRALATLPDIDSARVFEPQPEEVHTWKR